MSSQKSPDIRGLLLEGHFGSKENLPPSDPIAVTQMLLEIDRILSYDKNPRRGPNPRHGEIKASIRAKGGLNNPLTVTRRPGDEHYTVEAGGNTRLQILKELWAETGEEHFRRIHCLFVPWRSESHVLGAHLIENELRGDLLFIEKAQALKDLQEQLQIEAGADLNRSALQRALAEMGYSVSRRQLIRFAYALETVGPAIPKALRGGLGRRQVDQLRALEAACRKIHSQHPGATESFGTWFRMSLGRQDDDWLDLEQVQSELARDLASTLGLSPSEVRSQVDRQLRKAGSEIDANERAIEKSAEWEKAGFDDGRRDIPGRTDMNPGASPEPPFKRAHTKVAQPKVLNPFDDHRDLEQNPEPSRQSRQSRDEPILKESIPSDSDRLPREDDLKSQRSRAYVLATKISQALGFPETVKPWQGGYGFTLDLPKEKLTEVHHRSAWWLLLGLSEQAITDDRLSLLPEHLDLPRYLLGCQDEAVVGKVDAPSPVSTLPFDLLLSRHLPEKAFNDFLQLTACCRIIRRNFRESDLWQCLTVEQVRMRSELGGRMRTSHE